MLTRRSPDNLLSPRRRLTPSDPESYLGTAARAPAQSRDFIDLEPDAGVSPDNTQDRDYKNALYNILHPSTPSSISPN